MNPSKYKQILRKHHPKANPKGQVYEHRYFMELMLGRYLQKGEVVHHIDGNKGNNDESNLRLYSSYKEHKEEHYGQTDKRTCSLCGSKKTYIAIRKGKYKIPTWFNHTSGLICSKCKGKIYHNRRKLYNKL